MSAAHADRPRQFVFVNRYYRPDQSATSQMLTDLAQALAAALNHSAFNTATVGG